MSIFNQKIKDYTITVERKAKVKGTDRVIGLDTLLEITFADDRKLSFHFDYEKYAQDYIKDLYKKTGSIKVIYPKLFD